MVDKKMTPTQDAVYKCIQNYIITLCDEEIKDLKSHVDKNLFEKMCNHLVEKVYPNLLRVIYMEYVEYKKSNRDLNKEKIIETFNTNISNKNYIVYLQKKYLLLDSILKQKLIDTINYIKEIYDNYIKDKDLICKTIGQDLKNIVDIDIDHGDLHNGVSTCKVSFDNGVLFYKPMNSNNNVLFYKVLDYITNDLSLNIKRARTYSTKNHTWMEEIKYKTCNNIDEVKNYYYISGIYLAIFYIFTAYDMHHENIISHGSTPTIIDFETLSALVYKLDKAEFKDLTNSVLNSAYIPFINDNSPFDVNVSGILSKNEESNTSEVYSYSIDEEISIVKQKSKIIVKNQISLNEEKILDKYLNLEQIKLLLHDGFKYASNIIISNKDELKKIVTHFMDENYMEFRQILRPTEVYSRFLNACSHPDSLKSLENTDKVLSILLSNFKASKYGYLRVEHEIQDLRNGYVPAYYSLANDKNLYSNKQIVCKNYFDDTVKSKFTSKLESFDNEMVDYQLRLINDSILTLLSEEDFGKTSVTDSFENKYIDSDYVKNTVYELIQDFLHLEVKIADNISSLFVPHLATGKSMWRIKNMEKDLYQYGGVILTLFYYGLEFEDNDIIESALNLLRGLNYSTQSENLSVYSGEGGLLYLNYIIYSNLSTNIRFKDEIREFKEKYMTTVDYILNNLNNKELNIDSIDYMNGDLAGLYLICKIFYQNNIPKEILNKIKSIENNIIEKYNRTWFKDVGFAHGNTGSALIIAELFNITKNKKLLTIIEEMLVLENSALDHVNINNAKKTWCRGFTGIIYGRRLISNKVAIEFTNDSFINKYDSLLTDDEINSWLNIDNYCLCHGLYGNIEIIHKILSSDTKDIILKSNFKSFKQLDWFNNQLHIQNDLFMLGNFGIAYVLLELISDNIPSILSLEINNQCDIKGDNR